MPLRTAARRCPDATFLPSDPAAYDAASDAGDGVVARPGAPGRGVGLGRGLCRRDGRRSHRSRQNSIRAVISSETGLSCSVGISDNKQRAKVATGFAKPAGIFVLTDANWMTRDGRPARSTHCGAWVPRRRKSLPRLGITTVRELAHADAELLTSTFGPRTGLWLLLLAKGGGDTDVSAEPWVPALPQPRRHLPARPHRPGRNGLGCNADWPGKHWMTCWRRDGSSPGWRSPCEPRRSTPAPRFASWPRPPPIADAIIAAALRVLDLFELDRPVRLLGVRLELAMPD